VLSAVTVYFSRPGGFWVHPRLGRFARTIESHYWDSADRRLVESVLSLRLRKVDPSRPRCTVRRRRRGCWIAASS